MEIKFKSPYLKPNRENILFSIRREHLHKHHHQEWSLVERWSNIYIYLFAQDLWMQQSKNIDASMQPLILHPFVSIPFVRDSESIRVKHIRQRPSQDRPLYNNQNLKNTHTHTHTSHDGTNESKR